jgi:hypothetical protein
VKASSDSYINFPVHETIEVNDISDIRNAVDKIVEEYKHLHHNRNFSYRLLLPREEKSTAKAKKIGFIVQAEFLLALRKKKLKPNIKEIRYVHDENHYGWLLTDSEILDTLNK